MVYQQASPATPPAWARYAGALSPIKQNMKHYLEREKFN